MKNKITFFCPGVMSNHVAMEPGDFERSFFMGLLLQAPLATLDTSFYAVNEFTALAENSDSWLRGALEVGALIPIFREGHTFLENFQSLKKSNFTGLSANSESIANKLDYSFSKYISEKKFLKFPDIETYNSGRNLKERITKKLLCDDPDYSSDIDDIGRGAVNAFWGRTREIREKWIDGSVNHDRNDLRLSDLYRVAATDIAGDVDSGREFTGQDVLIIAKNKFGDGQKYKDIRNFLIAADGIWQGNFKESMNFTDTAVGISLPRLHPITTDIDLGIFPFVHAKYSKDEYEHWRFDAWERDKFTFKMPKIEALKGVGKEKFKAIWELGDDYRIDYKKWSLLPSDENFYKLRNSLDKYIKNVNKSILNYDSENFWSIANPRTSVGLNIAGSIAASILGWATRDPILNSAVSSAVAASPILLWFGVEQLAKFNLIENAEMRNLSTTGGQSVVG